MTIAGKENTVSRLRKKVSLEQPVEVADGYGGFEKSWSEMASLWVEILPLSGRESLRHNQLEGFISHRILLRYRAGITRSHRIKYDGRVFNIRAVMDIAERKGMLELLAEEGVAT